MTCGLAEPQIFDPRSLVNISNLVETENLLDIEMQHRMSLNKFVLKSFTYISETQEVIVVTSRRDVIIWRYNASANLAVLWSHEDGIESVAFSTSLNILYNFFKHLKSRY